MRVVQGFRALIESESSARTADIAFLDSALELIPEDQDSSADSLHTGRLKRQRHRFYNNAPHTKAKQTTNEEDKRVSWHPIALNGKPAK